jgi:DNA-binding MarR family transcriptional regulator
MVNLKLISSFRSILRTLEREIDLELKGKTGCCGVTLSQCHILLDLSILGETSIKDLSDLFGLDKSTLSRTIDGMVESGMITRITDNEDRRYCILSLTEKGKQKAKDINSKCNSYYLELMNNIPENKHSMIIESISLLGNSMKTLRKEKTGTNSFCKTKC